MANVGDLAVKGGKAVIKFILDLITDFLKSEEFKKHIEIPSTKDAGIYESFIFLKLHTRVIFCFRMRNIPQYIKNEIIAANITVIHRVVPIPPFI